jgi:tripartite-type tricarboxylate transporter receptor subunit TctC
MDMKRRSICKGLGLSLALPCSAFAQVTSGRPIRLIIPLSAGSAIDFVARVITPHLSTALGQPIIVDNRPGAEGVIGMQDMLRSPPDGNTLLLGSLSPLAINVAFVRNLPYDPRRDLTPVAAVYTTNHVLVVKSTFPARTFAEFIAYAGQRRGAVSVGHSTSLVQVQIATVNRMAGIQLLPVPYRGTPATITDVLGGTLDATLLGPADAMTHVNSGQMRALAVTSLQRNPVTPEWPAMSETLPGFDFSTWSALVGPRGLPRDLVNRIHAAVSDALQRQEVIDKLAQNGFVPWVLPPDELSTFIDAETARWVRMAQEANIHPE